MNRLNNMIGLVFGSLLATSSAAFASPVNGTGNVTPGVIYGSGNANGGFTGQTQNNIEVGLRAHQRYPAANIYNYNGVDTYTFNSLVLTTNPADRSVFNFDWSVNVDKDGSTGATLSDFNYSLSFDTDPSSGTSYSALDPFNTAGYYDHSLGNNGTNSSNDVVSTSNGDLLANILLHSVAQQSSNLGFGFSLDPDLPGIYGFKFEVFDKITSALLASSEIRVNVTPVPLPAALPLFAAGLGIFGLISRRRRDPAAV